jgi:hypothetical protein
LDTLPCRAAPGVDGAMAKETSISVLESMITPLHHTATTLFSARRCEGVFVYCGRAHVCV